MCTNYRPTSVEAFRTGALDDIRETKIQFKSEVFPNDIAPIIRLNQGTAEDGGDAEWKGARFGLVPFWAKDDQVAKLGRMAYNSRTETVSSKPMFRGAWRNRQFCLIPAEAFYEPNWESGKAVRWRIEMASHEPFAIGGIWESHGKGEAYFESFSMLTINADAHAVMNHFHKPGDEKRMPVIIEPENYLNWLAASTETAAQFFRPLSPDLMTAKPEPLAPRSAKLAKPRAKETADGVKSINELF